MPSKASTATTSTKDMDEALQDVTAQLGSLSTQLNSYQSLQDSRHESVQTLLHSLLDQFI